MAWCPSCKSEYKEGVTVCTDCNCELVDSLQDKDVMDGVALSEEERNAKKEELKVLSEMKNSAKFGVIFLPYEYSSIKSTTIFLISPILMFSFSFIPESCG